jgi:septation ring formation regulator EzrA
MYGGQNILRRLKNLMDRWNQQDSSTINDSQSILIHSLMERVLKQGDAIAEMEATLVGIKNSLSAFKSVIQKVETNTSLSIPNLLTSIKNQTDQIPALKRDILELQNKVEILQTSLEQFKIEQHERMTNGRGKSTCKSWQACLFFSSKIH